MPEPQKPNLNTHPLVTKLMGDTDNPPKLVPLTGYIGPSKKPDSVRLYHGLDFQSYSEIPKAAVVATTQTNPDDEHSPTVVHVKSGTQVDTVTTSTHPVESYLQGGITGGHLGSAAPTTPALAPIAPTITGNPCSGVHTLCCGGGGIQPTPSITIAPCCPITHQPCSGIHTQCCAISAPPCSGVHTQCCGGGGGIQPTPSITIGACCPITHQPCSGIHTQCCGGGIQPTPSITIGACCAVAAAVHPTPSITNNNPCCPVVHPTPSITNHNPCCPVVHPTPSITNNNPCCPVVHPLAAAAVNPQPTPTAIPTHQLHCSLIICHSNIVVCNYTANVAICYPTIIGAHCPSQHPVGCPAITHNC